MAAISCVGIEKILFVDGSVVPLEKGGIACLIIEKDTRTRKNLDYLKKIGKENPRAIKIYAELGELEGTIYIKGMGEGISSTQIEEYAIIYGMELKERLNIKEESTIYSDCLPNIEKNINNNIEWIASHRSNPPQEVTDIGAKLGNLFDKGEERVYKGKINTLIATLIEELERKNELLPLGEEETKRNKEFKGKDIFYLEEEDNIGLFDIYYEGTLAYTVESPTLIEVFLLASMLDRKRSRARVVEMFPKFKENARELREDDFIHDRRQSKRWVFFREDYITGLVLPFYTFKGPNPNSESTYWDTLQRTGRLDIRDIKEKEYCLYALPGLNNRGTTTSSTIVRTTKEVSENSIERVICVGSLLQCLDVSDKRKKYMTLRSQIKSLQGQIDIYKKLLDQTHKNEIKLRSIKAQITQEELNILKKELDITLKGGDIETIFKDTIKHLERKRSQLLGKSIEILKSTCNVFL